MLTEGLVKKKFNTMFVASLLGWMVTLVGDLADSILAGQFISEAAVSATGLVTPIFNFNFFFSVMIGLGSANLYSINCGKFKKNEAYKIAGQALILAFGAGMIFCTAMYAGEDLVFAFYNAGPEVEALAREYYEAMAILSFVAPPFWAFYYLVYIDGDSNLALASDLLQAFGNFGASLVLVQKMGIKGLALGSVIGVLLSWAILIPHFFSRKNSIHFRLGFMKGSVKQVCLLGSTIAMTSVYIGIVDVVFNKFILKRYGDSLLAAYAIINLIINLAQVSSCALDGGSGFITTAYAEGNSASLKKVVKRVEKTALIVSSILTVLFFACAKFAPNIYGIVDPAAYEASIFATRVLALSYIPSSIVFIYLGYLPKIESPGLANLSGLLYSLITPIAIAIPLGLISYNAMSVGFFLTPIVTLAVMAIIIIKKFGKENFPFPVPKTDAKEIFIHEFAVKDEEIVLVKNTFADELRSISLDESIINKLALMIEETFLIIKAENEKRTPGKTILADATVMVYDNQVKLITRDNGFIFDITKADEHLSSLEAYVAASLMNVNSETSNVTSFSFNRNLFCWDR